MSRRKRRNGGGHLVHLQVGARDPRLGIQGILGVGRIVLQTATLFQMGLELLPAPPEQKGKGLSKIWIYFRRASTTIRQITANPFRRFSSQPMRFQWLSSHRVSVAKLRDGSIWIKHLLAQVHRKTLTFLSCFHFTKSSSSITLSSQMKNTTSHNDSKYGLITTN